MKKGKFLILLFIVIFTVYGCGSATEQSETERQSESNEIVDVANMFTDRDVEYEYSEQTSVRIVLSGDSATSESEAVQFWENRITITEEGTYIFSGTLDDGMIVVNAPDTAKVQLVLENAQISNSTSAAIYVLEADKVFITTAQGTENSLSNGGEYVAIDENNIDSVVFSKSDLTLNGAGTLTVTATAGHGIVSKDDLIFANGTYVINAEKRGISGNDSVRIASGEYSIVSGKDGIRAENTEDVNLGFLYILDGTITIDADGDAVSASSYLLIDDGEFNISTGDGSASVQMKTEDFSPMGGFENSEAKTGDTADSATSQKGLKADGSIFITNGKIATDTADDSIHAGGNIQIEGGVFELRSGDDAIHSDETVTIHNGEFNIDYCYEGIEGLSILIENGTFDITSEDDGFNAAGGVDDSGFGGGGPEQDHFSSNSDNYITINGGEIIVVSEGDCIDLNGALTVNGGTLDLTCNSRMNTALDCSGDFKNNGGNITTNDGSENNPGQMFGGMDRNRRN